MTKKIIIVLAGRKASGKTTAAKHLVAELGFTRLSFADPIRNMVGDFLLDMGYGANYVDALLTVQKEQVLAPISVSPRHLMQTLGTEWGRDCVCHDVWTHLARRRLYRMDETLIVFDDVRFENEADMIRSLGGLIIHIDRGDLVTDHHASESGISDHDADEFVDNDYSINDFLLEINRVVAVKLAS